MEKSKSFYRQEETLAGVRSADNSRALSGRMAAGVKRQTALGTSHMDDMMSDRQERTMGESRKKMAITFKVWQKDGTQKNTQGSR